MDEFYFQNAATVLGDTPVGFGTAIWEEPGARQCFSAMSPAERALVLEDLRTMTVGEAKKRAREMAAQGLRQ